MKRTGEELTGWRHKCLNVFDKMLDYVSALVVVAAVLFFIGLAIPGEFSVIWLATTASLFTFFLGMLPLQCIFEKRRKTFARKCKSFFSMPQQCSKLCSNVATLVAPAKKKV
eukprot:GHVT01019889.1.p2 GENE.GHVT01019889.1~~GHVT01019889.1.p2  ORF type:complete len:112 (+),score=7.09 GHVT01019889.1:659-994(+)